MSDGSSNYGIEVTGPNGTSKLLSSNIRQTNILIAESPSIASNGTKTYTNIPDATSSNKIQVAISDYGASYFDDSFTITRSSANGGTIEIENDLSTTRTPNILIFRIA